MTKVKVEDAKSDSWSESVSVAADAAASGSVAADAKQPPLAASQKTDIFDDVQEETIGAEKDWGALS